MLNHTKYILLRSYIFYVIYYNIIWYMIYIVLHIIYFFNVQNMWVRCFREADQTVLILIKNTKNYKQKNWLRHHCSFAINNKIDFRHHCSFAITKESNSDTSHTMVVCIFAINNRVNLIFERNERDICTDKERRWKFNTR